MKKTALLVIGTVCLTGFFFLANVPAQVAAPNPFAPAGKWEYKVVKGELDEAGLNKLGDGGWELATATSIVAGGGGHTRGGSGDIDAVKTSITLIFKRAKR
jgi:hypothetical protein